jgi:2-polyprenyl-6-hydroxyphenyl methylase/3-demethylubiquinone-9 3-methyltransferase
MQPGPVIRRLFGPYEHTVAEAYRHIFVNLDDFARLIHTWVPQARMILEVGCGEGAMTERITRIYPAATVTAIDITPKVGRLFRGNRANVTFSQESVEAVASREPASFDLVILADVIHHVPADARRSLMGAIDQALTPDGSFIFKDWVITKTPINWLCGLSDRYLTGDKVSYLTMPIIESLLVDPFGPGIIRQTATVRPWDNNVAVLVRR